MSGQVHKQNTELQTIKSPYFRSSREGKFELTQPKKLPVKVAEDVAATEEAGAHMMTAVAVVAMEAVRHTMIVVAVAAMEAETATEGMMTEETTEEMIGAGTDPRAMIDLLAVVAAEGTAVREAPRTTYLSLVLEDIRGTRAEGAATRITKYPEG